MNSLNFNVFKRITLGLSIGVCTCLLAGRKQTILFPTQGLACLLVGRGIKPKNSKWAIALRLNLNQNMFRMKNIAYYLLVIILLSACTVAQIQQAYDDYSQSGKLTDADVGSGLKQALIQGITKGSNSASATDGFFKNSLIKIPFPPEAQKVEAKLRQLGMGKQVDNFVLTLNRGAEAAAKEAKPIFINAIKSMTIQDAWGILKGEPNAATSFLKRATTAQLTAKFKPVMQKALGQSNATKYYGDLVSAYNKVPFVDKVNPSLDDYATNLALKGLFTLVEKEEVNIRKNPSARATDLLKKVFGQQ